MVHNLLFTICHSPNNNSPKGFGFSGSEQNQSQVTEEPNHPLETANWPITRYSNGQGPEPSPTHKVVAVKICLHLYEREGRRNLTLEKSVSVYKSLEAIVAGRATSNDHAWH